MSTVDMSILVSKAALTRTIGHNVHKYRISAGLTQEELAEKVGIGASFIARIESGQKIMSVPVLYKIAEALHVSTDMLLYDKMDISTSEKVQTIINSYSPETISHAEKILRLCLSILES